MTFNPPTQTNPPFTNPPTWTAPQSSERWEADYRLRLLESAVIWLWNNPSGLSPPVTIASSNAAQTPLTVKGAVGQTASVLAVQNNASANLFTVDPLGNTTALGNVNTNTGHFVSTSGGNIVYLNPINSSPSGQLVGSAAGQWFTSDLTGNPRNVLDDGSGNMTVAGRIQNTRIQKRVVTVTQSANPSINSDVTDVASITGLAQAITSITMTGTPSDGDQLEIRITDNGTARAITWGTAFEASPLYPLPTITAVNVMLSVVFQWNVATSKWRTLNADNALVVGPGSALVPTNESTASLSYVDLASTGPIISAVTGTNVIVIVSAQISNTVAGAGGFMSFAVSGATIMAAGDVRAVACSGPIGFFQQAGFCTFIATLNPGLNIFTAKYRASGSGTASFVFRSISIIPLP
jgi:hypothetical protein